MKTEKPRPKRLNKLLFKKRNKKLALFIKQNRVRRVNGKNHNDRLEKLKAKYEQEIRVMERELAGLKAKLATLQTFAQESEKLTSPETEPDKYKNMGATQAILDAVDSLVPSGIKDKRGATAREICDYLLAHGFQPKTLGQTFSIAVAVTLRRLADDDRVSRVCEGNGNFYRPGKPSGKELSMI